MTLQYHYQLGTRNLNQVAKGLTAMLPGLFCKPVVVHEELATDLGGSPLKVVDVAVLVRHLATFLVGALGPGPLWLQTTNVTITDQTFVLIDPGQYTMLTLRFEELLVSFFSQEIRLERAARMAKELGGALTVHGQSGVAVVRIFLPRTR